MVVWAWGHIRGLGPTKEPLPERIGAQGDVAASLVKKRLGKQQGGSSTFCETAKPCVVTVVVPRSSVGNTVVKIHSNCHMVLICPEDVCVSVVVLVREKSVENMLDTAVE